MHLSKKLKKGPDSLSKILEKQKQMNDPYAE